jgi:outer membrane lipoprotein-sorting protein
VRHRRFVLFLAVLPLGLLLLAGSAAAAPHAERRTRAEDPQLAPLLAKFDQVQTSMRSLSADLTRTTVSPLFREPKVAKGRLYLSKPSSVLWEFTSPEPMRFLISGDAYTGYFPERKRAERQNVQRYSEQIFRFVGVGQSSAELRKAYDLSLGTPDEDAKGAWVLVLEPRRRRVRRHLEEARLWIDPATSLPVKFSYRTTGGATETVVFRNVRLNPELSASLFRLDLPSDVVVTTGFSVFGETGAGSPVRR